MTYLIDGYNLLYAMGVLHGRTGPTGLEKARLRLLGLLHAVFGAEAPNVTVVFDAAGAPAGATGEENWQGIHVRYAVREAEADDLIEALIAREANPRRLTVVSDDRRLQKAARRRHCAVLGCLDFVEELGRRRHRQPRPPPEGAKPAALSEDERKRWLEAFADLTDDPAWKKFSDPYGFAELENWEPPADE